MHEELFQAIQVELKKVGVIVDTSLRSLRSADAGKIEERVERLSDRHKVRKHFDFSISDGFFSYTRKEAAIEEEGALDSLYVIRTTCPETELTKPASAVLTYK